MRCLLDPEAPPLGESTVLLLGPFKEELKNRIPEELRQYRFDTGDDESR